MTSSFYGIVTADGELLPASTVVSAAIDGQELEVESVFTSPEGTAFRIDVPGDIAETPGVEGGVDGQTVVFRVAGTETPQSGVFQGSLVQRLDLTAPVGPDLAVALDDGRTSAAPGEQLTYSITVTNLGELDATGVAVTDTLPEDTAFLAAGDGGSLQGVTVTWPAFDLAAGTSATRTLTVEVAPTVPAGAETLTSTATVADDSAGGFDPEPANNSAADVDSLDAAPDLAVAKTDGRAEIAPGETLTYTLTISNAGNQDAADVQLVDVLPRDVTFFTASGDGGETSAGLVTWPPFTLAAGATVTRIVNLRLEADTTATSLTNTAGAIPGNGPDADPADNSGSDTTAVRQQTDLSVASVDPSTAAADLQSLEITGSVRIEVGNSGNAPAGDFEVTVFEDSDGDGALSPADNVLGQAAVSGVPAFGTASFDVPVAGTVLFRDNRLYAFVDSAEQLAELDESNNVDHSAKGCIAVPVPEAFAPVVELAWPADDTDLSFPNSKESLSTPIVAQLTDDNSDGTIDAGDVPDIVFVTGNRVNPLDPQILLRAIRGDTGRSIFTVQPPAELFTTFAPTGLAAADFDGDGVVELVVSSLVFGGVPPNVLVAYEHTGQRKWISDGYRTHPDGATVTNRDNPTIADLDGDGTPEILVGANVFDAAGRLQWSGTGGQAYQSAGNRGDLDSGAISIAVDLDLAGGLEVVTGNTAYRADGSLYWQVAMDDGYPAIGNFDGDDFPEIVVVSRGLVRLHEHDGGLIWGPVELPGAGAEAGGAPTVADFDADGEPEIGVAGSTMLAVFETDGTVKWQRSTRDASSNMTGSTVFDLDGDGRFEVIYRDETHLRIYRGADGVVLFEEALSSETANEEVVVADVDADGRAEIIVSSDLATTIGGSFPARTAGIRVFGDGNDNWVATRQIWNQHAYHADNVRQDGSVPAQPERGWLTHNTFRANLPPAGGSAFDAADLSASRTRVSFAAWPQLAITVRIGNGGLTAAPRDLPVAFYDGEPGAGGELLGVVTVPRALAPGELEDVTVVVSAAAFGPATVVAVADDDGSGGGGRRECDESNNRHRYDYDTEAVGLLLTLADGADAVQPGGVVTYTLTAANGGPLARTGVSLSATLPPHVSFLEASDGGALAGDTVSWPAASLPGRATLSRSLSFRVDEAIPLAVSELTTRAAVADDGALPDPTPENNTAADTNRVLTVRADAGGPYAGGEGQPIAFDASASSDRDGTVVAYAWDLDADGIFDDADGAAASRAFADEGTYAVAVQVTDDSGETDTAVAQVTVANLPPAVDLGPDRAVTEGDAATLAGTVFSDPGSGDLHTATIDWGDGSALEAGVVTEAGGAGTVAGGHTYPDDGVFTVEVCVADDDGATACDQLLLTVGNSAPVVLAADDFNVDLGTWNSEDYVWTFRDPPSEWDVLGTGERVFQRANSVGTFFYGDFLATGVTLEGELRVSSTVDDDFIGFALGFEPGDTANPNADFLLVDWKKADQTATDGCFGTVTGRTGLAVSRVRGVPHKQAAFAHLAEPCDGDGSVEELARGHRFGTTGWEKFAPYIFTFDLTPSRLLVWVDGVLEFDLAGDFHFGSGRFAFYNFSQDLVRYNAFLGQGLSFAEGELAEIAVPFQDAGLEDTHSATVDWRDGTVDEAAVVQGSGTGSVPAAHVYLDDGTFDARICATDDDGATGCGTLPLQVINVPPGVDAGRDRVGRHDEPFALAASFTDPGLADSHGATIDWGDGTVEAATAGGTPAAGSVAGSHLYAEEGDYPVEVCVSDDDGATGCDRFVLSWVAPRLDFAVVPYADRPAVRPGEELTFTLAVHNRGTLEPRQVRVESVLPPHLSFVSASDGGTLQGDSVVWTLPVLPYRASLALTLTLRADPTLPFGVRVDSLVTVSDDGSQGADAAPADNSAVASVLLWDAVTPIVDPQAVTRLARAPGVTFEVSSSSPNFPPELADDGQLATAWRPACGDAANRGNSPFFEVTLPNDATVRQLRLRQWTNSSTEFLAGIFRLYDRGGTLLHDTGEMRTADEETIDLPGLFGVPGVRRVRFISTEDEHCSPALSELQVFGVYGEPGPLRRVPEGERAVEIATFTDTDSGESHSGVLLWGDGAQDPAIVRQSNGLRGVALEDHDYPADDGTYPLEVCVSDSAGHTGCGGLTLAIDNAPPRVLDGAVDLRRWTSEDYPGTHDDLPEWRIDGDGLTVEQLFNSDPTVLAGDFEALGTRLQGTVRVVDDADDDHFGFVLGFQPGDSTNPQAGYLLVDWKQADQAGEDPCIGPVLTTAGLAVSRVRGIPHTQEFGAHLDHPCYPDGGVEELARAQTLGDVGWLPFRDIVFTFDVRPDRLQVFVDGALEIDLAGDIAPGHLGFYNRSQPNVRYSAFDVVGLLGDEGTALALEAFFVDPGRLDTHTATVDWSDGASQAAAVIPGPSADVVRAGHIFADDGLYPIRVCVTDDDGATACGDYPATVSNLAPAVDGGPDTSGLTGSPLDLAAAFTDPGVLDTHTATVDWGDGTVEPATVVESGGAGSVAAGHLYAAPGTYPITVCVADDDGGEGCDSLVATVEEVKLLSIGDVTVTEGDPPLPGEPGTEALFTVQLTPASTSTVTVEVATVDGSATAGSDYGAVATTLSFAPGETARTVAVPIVGDLALEDDETFTLELSGPTGALLGDASALGTILDDELCESPELLANPGAEAAAADGSLPGWTAIDFPDAPGAWQQRLTEPDPFAGAASFYAGEVELGELVQDVDLTAWAEPIDAGGQRFAFTGLVRTADEVPPDVARLVVEYRDATGTVLLDVYDTGEIVSPLEWLPVADTRAAPAGTRAVRVRLLTSRFVDPDDPEPELEADAYFDALSLRSLRTAVLTVGGVEIDEGDSGTVDALFPVTLSCPVDHEVTATVATLDDTALAGEDYTAVAGPLSLAAGETVLHVPVPVLGDTVIEGDERFVLQLSGVTGAVAPAPQAVGHIVDAACPCMSENPLFADLVSGVLPIVEVQVCRDQPDQAGIQVLLADGTAIGAASGYQGAPPPYVCVTQTYPEDPVPLAVTSEEDEACRVLLRAACPEGGPGPV